LACFRWRMKIVSTSLWFMKRCWFRWTTVGRCFWFAFLSVFTYSWPNFGRLCSNVLIFVLPSTGTMFLQYQGVTLTLPTDLPITSVFISKRLQSSMHDY
jgi:hypothetical protein